MNIVAKTTVFSLVVGVLSGCSSEPPDLGPKEDLDPSTVYPGDPQPEPGALPSGDMDDVPRDEMELPPDHPRPPLDDDPMWEPNADAGVGDGGRPNSLLPSFYSCQNTDQAFVRNAILGVLGRRPYSQAEVNVYTDLMKQIDDERGTSSSSRVHALTAELSPARKAVLEALFSMPEYKTYWGDLYRDLIRVQRVDEIFNLGCFGKPGASNPIAAAKLVRDRAAPIPAATSEAANFTMHDIIEGSVALDDVSPIYTANLFAMLTLTYAGANAEPAALELTRRADFGAWFDAVYLHRDIVCLGCHNSEFSVTQSDDPMTNRHFPIPFALEKSLFGASTGPATFGGFEGGDRAHAPLKYKHFVNDCSKTPITQATAIEKKYKFEPCASPDEPLHRCGNGETICETVYKSRQARPWGWSEECGLYAPPERIEADLAGVEAHFGNLRGLRTSPWDLAASLRAGFEKLRTEGLQASDDGAVSDPDKAFAYLVSMAVAEKVWMQVVGTPLTIPTRFPRNAASRDQLRLLTDTFVRSGFSNRALLEAVFASPYINQAAPRSGCGESYGLPAIFDPWVTAEDDPIKRKNSTTDGIVSMSSRTAANALYAALEWKPMPEATFPDVGHYKKDDKKTPDVNEEDPMVPIVRAERQFQEEIGIFLKNAQPGFRGFDFQARLGWEDRFGTCEKGVGSVEPDYIDKLATAANEPDRGTVRDLVAALKDRLLGRASIEEISERPALELILGAPLDADANSLATPAESLRRVCGVLVSSPQFLLLGSTPRDALAVPRLTPVSSGYGAFCARVAAVMPPEYQVTCLPDNTLSLNGLFPSSR